MLPAANVCVNMCTALPVSFPRRLAMVGFGSMILFEIFKGQALF